MTNVETVRGPVESGRLGRTLMHEHIFVLDPAMLRSYGTAWGEQLLGRGPRGRARGRSAAPAEGRRVRDARRSDGARHRPLRALHPARERRGRPQHHRRDRPLRLRRAAAVPSPALSREDRAALHPGHPRGRRRHRGQGGVPEVRRRGARADRRRPADRQGDRARPPRDRRADHGAHERRRADRPVALRALQAEGVDPERVVIAHAGDSDDLDYLRASPTPEPRSAATGFPESTSSRSRRASARSSR